MFFIVIENVPSAIACVKGLHIQVMRVDMFLLLKFIKFKVQRFTPMLLLVQLNHVVKKHSHELLFLFG